MPDVPAPAHHTESPETPEDRVGLTGTIQALTEGRIPPRKRRFVTGFCAPTTILPGADVEVRLQRRCAGCGKRRLTTRTTSGPLCNDCLTAR